MPEFKANTSSAGTSRSSHQQQQQTTPSPPLASTAEQSPQLLGADGAGPCTSSSAASSSQGTSRPPPPLAMSGIRAAQSLAEWQLQAVLFRARLSQYFDVFISQGGDDIDQLIQCDEPEFLEIMSLVGMASKPLHVRRLQRTLNEFSNNKAQFLVGVVPFIGLPPFHYPGSLSTGEILTAVLKVLVPESKMPLDMSYLPQQQQQPVHGDFLFPLSQQNALPPPAFLGPKPESSFSFLDQQLLLSLLNAPSPAPGIFPTTSAASGSIKRARMSSSPPSTPVDRQSSAAFSSPRHSSPASDRLTEPELLRLVQLAHELVAQLPAKLEPRTGQGKRRVERGLLEAISLPVEDPLRAEHFRLFARIYGRFDAKRRPDKPLTRKERIVNEAATQLSLLRPDLLARRDELFPLARKLARMFELPAGMMEPGSPERSCSGASSAAESAVEMPSRERAREEPEGGDEEEAEGEEEEANVAAE